jgi:hypothetical protein
VKHLCLRTTTERAMFIFIILSIIIYLIAAGATYGYAKYRWPEKIKQVKEYHYIGYSYIDIDENKNIRIACTVCWPLYWIFIWPFIKTNEVTFSHIQSSAAKLVAQNKARIEDLQATRAQVEASNAELAQAELELEKEVNKL